MITSATKSRHWPAKYKLAPLFFLAGGWIPLAGVEVNLRELGNNHTCLIVAPGASNTNPVQITCLSAHRFVVGDLIQVVNVPGNTAANGLRKVKTIPTPTTFTITDANGVNVAGNGAWVNGDQAPGGAGWLGGVQRAGKVAPYTLQGHPRLLLSPGGNLIEFAASIENGLLSSIQVAGNVATATYSRAHGLNVGQKVCVYSAPVANLNCANPNGLNPSPSFTITATPSPTTLQFAVTGVTAGAYTQTNLTVSAWAHGGNPAWGGIHYIRSLMEAVYQQPGADVARERSVNFAIICHVNRADTTACNIAKWAITHIEDMASNFGVDETLPYGGDPVVDYISFRLFNTAQTYSLVRSLLTPTERQTFARKMLNDLNDPVLGGDCDRNFRADKPGIINKTADYFSPTTLNGTGTHFLTDLHVGDVLTPPNGVQMFENQYVFVTAIADDTHATGVGNGWSGPYSTVRPPTNTSCGAIWYSKHHPAGPFAHPLLYPPQGGMTIYGVSAMSNISTTKTWAYMALGMALADDDPRALVLITEMSVFYMDYIWPMLRNFWTGFSSSGSNYHYARVSYMVTDIIAMLRNGVVDMPDMTGGQYLKNLGAHLRYMWVPDASNLKRHGVWAWGADGGADILEWSGGRPPSLAAAVSLNPNDPEIHKTNYWIRNVFKTYDIETIGTSSALYAHGIFLRIPPTLPQLDYTAGPTQRIFRGTDRDVCLAQGSVPCQANGGFTRIVSRTGWTNTNDTAVGYEAADFYIDHSIQRAGDYVIYKTGLLVAGDSPGASASAGLPNFERYNMYAIGGAQYGRGEVSTFYGNINFEPYDSEITRWAGGDNDEGVAGNAYAYWLNDLTGTYTNVVTRQHRHVAHLKRPGAGEYVVVYDDAATSTNTSFRFFTHYLQNGQLDEGTTSCVSGCANVNTSREMNSQTVGTISNSVVTRFLGVPGVNTRVYVDSLDGTFPTGVGYSFRVSTCTGSGSTCATNANAYEMVTVHKVAAGAPGTIETTPLNPSSLWTGVQVPGYVTMFARNGPLRPALPVVTTTHAGSASYLVAGLAAGTYRFLRGGEPVAGCDNVTVIAKDNTAYCPSVMAGDVEVAPAGGPSSSVGGSLRLGATAGLQR